MECVKGRLPQNDGSTCCNMQVIACPLRCELIPTVLPLTNSGNQKFLSGALPGSELPEDACLALGAFWAFRLGSPLGRPDLHGINGSRG